MKTSGKNQLSQFNLSNEALNVSKGVDAMTKKTKNTRSKSVNRNYISPLQEN